MALISRKNEMALLTKGRIKVIRTDVRVRWAAPARSTIGPRATAIARSIAGSTSQPYALLRSLSVWFCGPECLRQQKLSSSCVHHHVQMLQNEFCECRADLFRKDAPWQP